MEFKEQKKVEIVLLMIQKAFVLVPALRMILYFYLFIYSNLATR